MSLNNFKTSSRGQELIKSFEGLRLNSYQCSAKVWTIGWGSTSGVVEGMRITESEAQDRFVRDLSRFEAAVNKMPYKLNQNQFDALVSFSFNLGVNSLNQLSQNGKRTLSQISSMIPAYNKAGGKVLQGLVRRRAAEKILFDTPV